MPSPTQNLLKEVERSEELLTSGSDFRRMVTLLRLAEGAWALAVYEDAAIRRQVTEQLRASLSPLPLIDISLLGKTSVHLCSFATCR